MTAAFGATALVTKVNHVGLKLKNIEETFLPITLQHRTKKWILSSRDVFKKGIHCNNSDLKKISVKPIEITVQVVIQPGHGYHLRRIQNGEWEPARPGSIQDIQ
ncbi:hypothetical protein JTB14_021622 [Gonioctena quinquepunctata]|nr:hypothetical protein JTB14_021622 [Gonioctena quinquepunctata]